MKRCAAIGSVHPDAKLVFKLVDNFGGDARQD
jgi:hypothetical protein